MAADAINSDHYVGEIRGRVERPRLTQGGTWTEGRLTAFSIAVKQNLIYSLPSCDRYSGSALCDAVGGGRSLHQKRTLALQHIGEIPT